MPFTLIEEQQLRALLTRNVDMHGRRVVNATDAVDAGDYVTKRQITGQTSIATPAAAASSGSTSSVPSAHASTHEEAGSDEINVTGLHGLLSDPQTPLPHVTTHERASTDELDVQSLFGLLEHPQDSMPHGDEHGNDGLDPLHLDDLADPSDNTNLNATSARHGLLPKLDGNVAHFLSGAGTFISAGGGGGGDPQYAEVVVTSGNISTSSTSMVDLTGITVTLTTGAHRVFINFIGGVFSSTSATIQVDVVIDGVSLSGVSNGFIEASFFAATVGGVLPVGFSVMSGVLSAGSHTIKIQWRTQAGTATMIASTNPCVLGVTEKSF